MRVSCRPAPWVVFAAALSFAGLGCSPANSEPTGDDDVAVVISDAPADPAATQAFAVPDGSPAELIAFIERLANPQQQFADETELRKYLDGVSTAIGTAADQILASPDVTEQQFVDAVEWKLEALRIRGELGDADADQRANDFLTSLESSDRPGVADAIRQIRANRALLQLQNEVIGQLQQWNRLDDQQRNAFADKLIEAVKSGEPSAAEVKLVMYFCDMLSDPPDNAIAARVLDALLPVFRSSDDPAVERAVPLLEGLGRRLTLLGSTFELSGEFLDGQEIDWASYRGKVVLVDFWATWCNPCLAEVPNILQNYQKFHDKGFEVVGVCLDDNRQDPEKFLAQAKIPWPSLFDDSGMNNPMAVKYGITGIPTAILVDQQGKVVNVQARGQVLGMELERLLGRPAVDRSSAVDRSGSGTHTAQSGQ